jgi:hypothetical protein
MFKLLIVIKKYNKAGGILNFQRLYAEGSPRRTSTYADGRYTPRVAVGVCLTP